MNPKTEKIIGGISNEPVGLITESLLVGDTNPIKIPVGTIIIKSRKTY